MEDQTTHSVVRTRRQSSTGGGGPQLIQVSKTRQKLDSKKFMKLTYALCFISNVYKQRFLGLAKFLKKIKCCPDPKAEQHRGRWPTVDPSVKNPPNLDSEKFVKLSKEVLTTWKIRRYIALSGPEGRAAQGAVGHS